MNVENTKIKKQKQFEKGSSIERSLCSFSKIMYYYSIVFKFKILNGSKNKIELKEHVL